MNASWDESLLLLVIPITKAVYMNHQNVFDRHFYLYFWCCDELVMMTGLRITRSYDVVLDPIALTIALTAAIKVMCLLSSHQHCDQFGLSMTNTNRVGLTLSNWRWRRHIAKLLFDGSILRIGFDAVKYMGINTALFTFGLVLWSRIIDLLCVWGCNHAFVTTNLMSLGLIACFGNRFVSVRIRISVQFSMHLVPVFAS